VWSALSTQTGIGLFVGGVHERVWQPHSHRGLLASSYNTQYNGRDVTLVHCSIVNKVSRLNYVRGSTMHNRMDTGSQRSVIPGGHPFKY